MLNRATRNSNRLNPIQTTLHKWIKVKETFKRAEISEQATLLGIKDRTLSDILNSFIKLKLIAKVSHGVYKKR